MKNRAGLYSPAHKPPYKYVLWYLNSYIRVSLNMNPQNVSSALNGQQSKLQYVKRESRKMTTI